MANTYADNSCHVDTALVFLETCFLEAVRVRGVETALPMRDSYTIRAHGSDGGGNPAHGPGEVDVDIGTAVADWWRARHALRCLRPGCVTETASTLVAQLDEARGRVRRELALASLSSNLLKEADDHVARYMVATGNAPSNVGRMLQDTPMETTHLVKLGRVQTCGVCHSVRCNVLPRRRTVPVATPAMLTVTPNSLQQVGGSVTQVVAAKLTDSGFQEVACVECLSEGERERGYTVPGWAEAVVAGQLPGIDLVAWGSAADTPPLLLLELPELLIEDLRLDESMGVQLPRVDGHSLQVDYHLAAVIFHTGHHYVCDARGADAQWRRYDDLERGGATQCARPTGNGRWRYMRCFPVLALYAR